MAETLGPVEPAPGLTAAPLLRAAAGVAVTGQVTITNTAAEPRVMSLSLHGVDAAWLPAPSRSEALAPGASITAELVLQPAVGTIAARYPIAVAVQALDPRTGQTTGPTALAEIVLLVDAPGQVAVDLEPPEATAVFGKQIRIRLRNDGALPAHVDLQVQAPSSARVSLQHDRVEVPPASTVTVRGRVRPRRVHLFGHRARHAYTVTGRSAGAPRHAEGILTTRALLGPNATKAAALIAVVAVWIALAVVFVPKLADWAKPGKTVHEAAGSATTAPGASGAPGSGGPSAPGSGGGPGGSSAPGGGGAAASADSVQLNGTVGGTSPSGVTVSMRPTSLVDEDAEGAIPVGLSTAAHTVGKIPAEALTTRSAPADGQVRSVTTTADGAWSFPAVAKPGYYLLSFSKPGFQTVRYIVDSTTADATKPLNVTLSAGQGQLSGVVNGPGGRVGGAQVTITDGTNTITTSTDSTGDIGSWSVVGLSTPASYLVSASKDGLGTESALITLDAGGSDDVTLTLRAGVGTVTGTVQSSSGERLGGVSVTATDSTLSRSATTVTEAGLRGRYTLSGLNAPGKYTVTFSAQGYLQQTVRVALAAGQSQVTADVTLFPSTATVTGELTDKSGPLVGAGLTLTSSAQTYKTTSGSDGSYRFDGIAPGSYVLTAEYAGLSTVFKTVTVAPGSTAPISLPGFELTELPDALSEAKIVGFVSDGSNPSNTLCPSDPSSCTVTFRLADTEGKPQTLKQDSVAAAPSGPTSYSLEPSAGVQPGVYRLTIAATGYLPVTVRVQLPLAGIANAPPASLYPANSIDGTVRTVGNLSQAAPGTTYVNCVFAVPSGSPAPDLSSCDKTKLPASQCEITGAPGPAYAEIDSATNTFRVDALCDGSYDIYVAITNPWYVQGGKKATLAVSHGQIVPLSVDIQRKAQLRLTMQQIDRSTKAAKALDAGTVVNLTCSGGGAGWTPKSVTVAAGDTTTTQYLVGGFDPGYWRCSAAVSLSNYATADTGYVWMSYGAVSDATLVFTQTIQLPVFGRVTTSWQGSPTGLAGAQVTISGVTHYVNQQPVTDSVTLTTDANGCFAITSDGLPPDTTSAPGACKNDTGLTGEAAKKLALVVSTADVHVQPPGTNYSPPPDLVNQRMDSTTLLNISVSPVPMTFPGLTLVTEPAGGALTGVNLQVTAQPPGAGAVRAILDPATGAISWQDSGLPAGQIVAGTYTITASGTGYVTTPYTFTCTPGASCDVSKPFTIKQLGSLKITVAGTTDPQVLLLPKGLLGTISPTQQTGNVATFAGLTPGAQYDVRVQAAGYQFGSTVDGSVTLACGLLGTDTTITISAGAQTDCTATPTRDGLVKGIVAGVLGAQSATTPSQLLSGASVTLTCSSLASGKSCTNPLTGTALTFTTTTKSDGSFTITGTKTVQGLDAGTWDLKISYPGYTDYVDSSLTVTASADTDLSTVYLYVTPVNFAVTVLDQNDDPATGLTAVLVGTGITPEVSGNVYTFNNVIPGSYTLQLTRTGYVSATTQVQVVVGVPSQSFTTYISQAATRVSGTVTGVQGSNTVATALAGVTVCIVTDSSKPCSSSADVATGTDKQSLSTTTGADGSFSFGTVPDGTYYVRAERYGYLDKITAAFTVKYPGAGAQFALELTRVTHLVTVTVTASSTADDLSASKDWALTSAGSDPKIPANKTLSGATVTPGSNKYAFSVQAQMPYGCWALGFTAPADHYGTLSSPAGTPNDTDLPCPAGSFQVPGTGTAAMDVAYTFTEYQPVVTVTLTALATDTAPTSATATLTAEDSRGNTYTDTAFTVPATDVALPVWFDSPATVSVVDISDPRYPAYATVSPTGTFTLPLTEIGSTVTVTVTDSAAKAVSGATVKLTPPTGTGITWDPNTLSKISDAKNGVATFTDVPFATGWTADATLTQGKTTTTGSATFDISSTTTSVPVSLP